MKQKTEKGLNIEKVSFAKFLILKIKLIFKPLTEIKTKNRTKKENSKPL